MKLVKSQCKKEGMSSYTDLCLVFDYEGKSFNIRVRPVFWRDMGLLKNVATDSDKE